MCSGRTLLPLLVVPVFGLLVGVGCGTIEIPTTSGTCDSSDECGEGLCVEGVCVDSADDGDNDGLTNAVEATLGTDPTNADSDGDGLDDGVEIGSPGDPKDSDGDNVIDALESATADSDSDCIPDQSDPTENPTIAADMMAQVCDLEGVCATGATQPIATCTPGATPDDAPTWTCDYSGVTLYDGGPETACDDLDNDCDGETDEDFQGDGAGCAAKDKDSDGLSNDVEETLGTNPDEGDTDGDGLDDLTEVGDVDNPSDSDGDGTIDALESSSNDADGDCINDQYDVDDASDTVVAKKLELCLLGGVCASGAIQPKAECAPGANPGDEATWFCSYGGVTGYDPSPEITCNGLDNDCDGETDEDFVGQLKTCGTGACVADGMTLCQDGVEVDGCEPLDPQVLNDLDCNNVDDDCDGETDEEYVGSGTVCGVGMCEAAGTTGCVSGNVLEDCVPGAPAANDATCDGADDDCDGVVDEDFSGTPPTCGAGACLTTGQLLCVDGVQVEECTTGPGAPDDVTCDGVDDDCDGTTDEDYASASTECGVGACAAAGEVACIDGETVDSCVSGPASDDDASCNGIDDDCDGVADEDYVVVSTECGTGPCVNEGDVTCVDGAVVNGCAPLTPPSDDDTTCDGIDDDCDTAVDEDFAAGPTVCGQGACASGGFETCDETGTVLDSCEAGEPGDEDLETTCDGVDQDCDGSVDEAFASSATECGQGECVNAGETTCVDGVAGDTCEPIATDIVTDASCDDSDDDCDGLVDEDYAPEVTACGDGACAGDGVTSCVDGVISDTCAEGEGGQSDASCDGVDNDCDGDTDEDYAPVIVSCGEGFCAQEVLTSCDLGVVLGACTAGAPLTADDTTCDGVDDDCDGTADEDFVLSTTACGVGACADTGYLVCQDGGEVDTCVQGSAGPNDASCNASDDDCDGATDEDFAESSTSCGLGACAAVGAYTCVSGQVVDTCEAAEGAAVDFTCDGVDDDCDGDADEDYLPGVSNCGVGACASTGQRSCINGVENDTCVAGQPASDDTTCDGVDDDCDGAIDDAYVATITNCGVGACATEGVLNCIGGHSENTCVPLTAAPNDVTCDGIDDNCNGQVDEQFTFEVITCGVGACENEGTRTCASGALSENCNPLLAAANDQTCDGIDDDCDGETDDDYIEIVTECGGGACAAVGQLICTFDANQGGAVEVDTCAQVEAGATDDNCNGIDDDCNGETDEGYVAVTVSCGVGECLEVGATYCDNGTVLENCTPADPATADTSCDGKDDDCNGVADEDYIPVTTSCGLGTCVASGQTSCVEGVTVDSCAAAPVPAGEDDWVCDGYDTDCDGQTDEGFQSETVSCGQGVCQASGYTVCDPLLGYAVDDCTPLDQLEPADFSCDGYDSDCDGQTDEDYVPYSSTCGVGECVATGTSVCASGGAETDGCTPLVPSANETDASCDGKDDDCDGLTDEGYVGATTTCGVGNCVAQGQFECIDVPLLDEPYPVDNCQPESVPVAPDGSLVSDHCGGGDEDCDGELDEDFNPAMLNCGAGTCAVTTYTVCDPVTGAVTQDCTPTGEPSCANRVCGDDGCGGACGSCPTVDPCETATCSPEGHCVFTPLADWSYCNDGLTSTVEDFCFAGRCIGLQHQVFEPETSLAWNGASYNEENYTGASRRIGGGVHAVYTSKVTGLLGLRYARAQYCDNSLECPTQALDKAGDAQAICMNFVHVAGAQGTGDIQALWKVSGDEWAPDVSNFQTNWMDEFGKFMPFTTMASAGDDWIAGAFQDGDELLIYRCVEDGFLPSCGVDSLPEGTGNDIPVEMRNDQGTPTLATRAGDSGKPRIMTWNKEAGGWVLEASVPDERQMAAMAVVIVPGATSYRVGVGRDGLLFANRGGETVDLEIASAANQSNWSFFDVGRFGDWLVVLGIDADNEYLLAYAPWGPELADKNEWGVFNLGLESDAPTVLQFVEGDDNELVLFGNEHYNGDDETSARSIYRTQAHAPPQLLLSESFGNGIFQLLWSEETSCAGTQWYTNLDAAGAQVQGCPDSADSAGLYYGTMLWAPVQLEESFTMTVEVTADDDDAYGVVYGGLVPNEFYRFSMDKERGVMRLVYVDAGAVTVLAERSDLEVPMGERVLIQVQAIGGLHMVSVNGDSVLQTVVNNPPGAGVGLYTWAMDHATFHSLVVTTP